MYLHRTRAANKTVHSAYSYVITCGGSSRKEAAKAFISAIFAANPWAVSSFTFSLEGCVVTVSVAVAAEYYKVCAYLETEKGSLGGGLGHRWQK